MVHSLTSKALQLILDEVEKYRVMKEEIRHRKRRAIGSLISEEAKSELIRLGRAQARTCFIKKLAVSECS